MLTRASKYIIISDVTYFSFLKNKLFMLRSQSTSVVNYFLKNLCRIKGWSYHDAIEAEKKNEIKEFIHLYVFESLSRNTINKNVVIYYRLKHLFRHPSFKPAISVLITLLESCDNENEFANKHAKVLGK